MTRNISRYVLYIIFQQNVEEQKCLIKINLIKRISILKVF